ncbi:pentapeptide repeat-containing protein [Chitinophaga pendula]|uniref:pentapeptide repeat-containing protein n=1 Tax=Chitinophaga TaxID=79328 RepID=UPI000BB09B93|nr:MULTISPECIES: pentapeptide repeat-containing protein [Chitinophaga]ASZ12337.1 hypothetical protein CK934_15900 [Chitinophaga sp. MD30]UCJ10069.1 pentapeptide repeat-containing protein [Chitinophaga pendula]
MKEQDDIILHFEKEFNLIDYANKHIVNRHFDHCKFMHSNIGGCVFENCRFDNCVFESCDLSLIKLKNTGVHKVSILHSKAIGIWWHEAKGPININFEDSKISHSCFAGKNLKQNRFINCVAEEVDFSGCNLTKAVFTGTDLQQARFEQTDLTQADLSGAMNYFIDPLRNKIKKAKFSLPAALSFLQALDIRLVD